MKKKTWLGVVVLISCSLLAQAQTWEAVKRLTYTTRYSEEPDVAAYGPNIFVVWREYGSTPSYTTDLYCKRSTDTGATWSAPLRLTWGTQPSSPSIAMNATAVHIVYLESYNLIYRKSVDNGATFSRTQITWGLLGLNFQAMAANGNSLHVVFGAYSVSPFMGLYHKRSTDNGVTWSAAVRLGDVIYTAPPSIAVSGTNVHVAYSNDTLHWGHMDLHYRRSTDNGVSWSAPLQLASLGNVQLREAFDSERSVFTPSVTAAGARVHLFYASVTGYGQNPAVYYMSSTDNGATWAAERRLTYSGYVYGYIGPKVSAADGLNVYLAHVIYDTGISAYEIYFQKSTDGGTTWSEPTRLTYLGNLYYNPWMVYSPGTGYFHLAFKVNFDSTTYFTEIYYKRGH